jgi:spermidine synthase
MADQPSLTQYDGIIEAYELEAFFERVRRVLDEKGVLTVADYQRELQAARNDGSRGSAG